MIRAIAISFCLVFLKYGYTETTEILTVLSFPEESNVENTTNVQVLQETDTTTLKVENETSEEDYDLEDFKFSVGPKSPPKDIHKSVNQNRKNAVEKMKSDVCLCDMTISSCDINCCCDKDCNDFHFKVFSHCEKSQAKIYDARYCYKKNFIVRNNTRFIHEKIADDLFCIVYDNLPPKYRLKNQVVIEDNKSLREQVENMEKTRPKWQLNTGNSDQIFSSKNQYQEGSVLWKLEGKFVSPLEFMQTGFNTYCNMKKSVEYLRDWKESCFQSDLSNGNKQLFPEYYSNLTILKSPLLLDKMDSIFENQICGKSICLQPKNHYCSDAWDFCTWNPINGGPCTNKTCLNVVKNLILTINHNGTSGMTNITAHFHLANVSSAFRQNLEILFEWADLDKIKVLKRSGNPGYIFGKPLILGVLRSNLTSGKTRNFYVVSESNNRILNLPHAKNAGECSNFSRHEVAFGKNVKTKCSVVFKTRTFTSNFCKQIQNKTLGLFVSNFVFNYSNTNDLSRTFVSRYGNPLEQNISNWTKIFVDGFPDKIVKGVVNEGEIGCEGLATSMKIDVLFAKIPKPEIMDNFEILGIGVRFSESSVLRWKKCKGKFCVNSLGVELSSYVSFHDVTVPTKYQFAVGPNVKLRLPHDFFYPFVNGRVNLKPSVIIIIVCLIINLIY